MSITWNPVLNELIVLLSGLYPDQGKARFMVKSAGLDPDEVDFAGVPKVLWMRIVEEANRRGRVSDLTRVAKSDFPNIDFSEFGVPLNQGNPIVGRTISDQEWKGTTVSEELERITGSQPTFLPISFLETGLVRARAVARIHGPAGIGSGFLTRNNVLVTNNHVISTKEEARAAVVWFNYQKTDTGADCQVSEFKLDPDDGFTTSPSGGGDDWAAIRVRGEPNAEWGMVDLEDVTVKANDFVNIIQHPNGLPKQIALYHNTVVYADDRRVQYLTDTMPGSSGSPVFDSEWRIVALHHSGGWLREPGTNKVLFRNEGIHVRALRTGLQASGLF
jgi:S1-C subfamily serine protease